MFQWSLYAFSVESRAPSWTNLVSKPLKPFLCEKKRQDSSKKSDIIAQDETDITQKMIIIYIFNSLYKIILLIYHKIQFFFWFLLYLKFIYEHTLISEYEKEKFWLIISLILSYYLGVYLNLLSQLIICMNNDVLLAMILRMKNWKNIKSKHCRWQKNINHSYYRSI